MYSKVFVVLALTTVAFSHDILEGTNNTEARNLFDAHFEASPAIWKQAKDLFINASEHEVISQINITDLRPDKDGDAQITAGGVGHNNVTITLKSPTILRGYDFLVSVYCVFDHNETIHEHNFNSQPPWNAGGENPEIPKEKIPSEIQSDVTTGKPLLSAKSGPTTVTGKPTEVPDKPTEVTDKPTEVTDKPAEVTDKPTEVTDTTLFGEVTSKPKTKEFSEPDVTETLEDVLEESPIHVHWQEPKKVEPFIGFHPPRRPSTTERY